MRRFATLAAIASCLVVAWPYAVVAGLDQPTKVSELKLSPGSLLGKTTALDFKGLLDPNRLTFRNRLGVSFQSGAFGGMSQYYTNTITYRASKPLVIVAQVGLENRSFGNASLRSSAGGARLVLPYFGLHYQPRENVRIDISISHIPAHYGNYGGFRY